MPTSDTQQLTRGKVVDQRGDLVVLSIPNTDYRLHLVPDGEITPNETGHVQGALRAVARRVDVVSRGGRYIDPAYGRPRILQGRVAATNAQDGRIAVACAPGVVFHCKLAAPGQSVDDFVEGQLVSFSIDRGATLTQSR